MALQFVPRFRSSWHPKRRRNPAKVRETLQVLLQTQESVFVATRCCYGMQHNGLRYSAKGSARPIRRTAAG
jgi:hypothetical protein